MVFDIKEIPKPYFDVDLAFATSEMNYYDGNNEYDGRGKRLENV